MSQIEIYSEFQVSLSYLVRKTGDRQTDLRRLSSARRTDWIGTVFRFLKFEKQPFDKEQLNKQVLTKDKC